MSDPTDPGRVTGSQERVSRTPSRPSDSGSPVGSPLTIVLTLIALAAGLLIFRSISDDGNAGGLPGGTTLPVVTDVSGNTVPTTLPGQVTTPTAPAVTPPPSRIGATVVVGNASAASGVAAGMTEQLTELGYTMGAATDQAEGQENLETSIVYYVVGNDTEAVARSLANDLGGLTVEPMPSTEPVVSMGDGTVLLMLGNDLAGEEIPGAPPSVPSVPSAPTTATTQPT